MPGGLASLPSQGRRAGAALGAALLLAPGPAAAFDIFSDPPYPDPPGLEAPPLRHRVGFGAEGTPRWASAYGSFTRALDGEVFGRDLGGDLRGTTVFVRWGAGAGRYRYRLNPEPDGRVRGDSAFTEAVIGQQWAMGPLFVSLAVGSGTETHLLNREDDANLVRGQRRGLKLEGSAFLRLDDHWAIEGFAGRLWGHDSWSARVGVTRGLAELGWRHLRLGLEVGGVGNRGSSEVRAGGVLEWAFAKDSALRLSGGASSPRDGRAGPYGVVTGWVGF